MSAPEKKRFTIYVRIFWTLVIIPLFLLLFLTLGTTSGLFGKLPTFDELENPQTYLASEVYSSDGQLLGKYYVQNRSNVQYKDISPYVIKGLVATEDARFFEHSGVDLRSLFRVFFKTIISRESSSGGGSTITQQLAKMLFPREKKMSKFHVVIQKIREWVIAARLERQYTKDEIITMYLNRFDFINNAVGIQSASRIYFSATPDSLKMEQAAVLVGMEKNPSLFNPVRRAKNSFERRNVVLFQMKTYNYITPHVYDSLKEIPIKLNFKPENPDEGLASYFREYLRDNFLRKWCDEHLKPDGTRYDIYKDGLKIYTTIDSRLQKYAEEAVEQNCKFLQPLFFKELKVRRNPPYDFRISKTETNDLITSSIHRSDRYITLREQGMSEDSILKIFKTPAAMTVFSWKNSKNAIDTVMTPIDSIKYSKSYLQTGFASIDPHTGYIKAWVGGIDHRFFKYDHVKESKRQVGSTFKPFIYTLAVQNGYSPCYKMPNVPITINYDNQSWTPKNAEVDTADDGKMMSLSEALAKSVDRIAAALTHQFSPQAVISLIRHMGITDDIEPVPSICLGTCEIPVLDMVGAYCTYANKGIWVEPTFVMRIEDKNGRVLDQIKPQTSEAMSQQDAYVMLNMMKNVVTYGTGVRLRYKYKLDNPIAGKTGTTQNCSDGWFIGITPDLVSGCWSGFEDRAIHFESMQNGQGATESLPVWAEYMIKAYDDKSLNISQGDFDKPDKPINIELDCDKFYKESNGNNGEIFK